MIGSNQAHDHTIDHSLTISVNPEVDLIALTLKLECLGFLTRRVRQECPGRVTVFSSEYLEACLRELRVSESVIRVASEFYEWDFRPLILHLSSGRFFESVKFDTDALNDIKAVDHGQAVLAALASIVNRLHRHNSWLEKLDGWPISTMPAELPPNNINYSH